MILAQAVGLMQDLTPLTSYKVSPGLQLVEQTLSVVFVILLAHLSAVTQIRRSTSNNSAAAQAVPQVLPSAWILPSQGLHFLVVRSGI